MALDPIAEAVQGFVDQVGAVVTLRRLVANASPVDVTVNAVDAGYTPVATAGGIVQGDREIRIGNGEILAASWPGPPRRGDQLIIDGRTFAVMAVDTRGVAGAPALHVIAARGAA